MYRHCKTPSVKAWKPLNHSASQACSRVSSSNDQHIREGIVLLQTCDKCRHPTLNASVANVPTLYPGQSPLSPTHSLNVLAMLKIGVPSWPKAAHRQGDPAATTGRKQRLVLIPTIVFNNARNVSGSKSHLRYLTCVVRFSASGQKLDNVPMCLQRALLFFHKPYSYSILS